MRNSLATKTANHARAAAAPVTKAAKTSKARASSGWMVTPTQAVLGRRMGIRPPGFVLAGLLALASVVGVVLGFKVGHRPRA